MKIELNVKSATITPCGGMVDATIDGVDKSQLMDHLVPEDVVKYFSIKDLLDCISEDDIKDYLS